MSEHNGLATSSASVPAPVAAPVSQEQQLLKHEDPTTTQAAHATVTTAPPSTVAATAAAATAAVGAAPANGTASPGESLACEWGQCGQVLPNAEALYVSMAWFLVFSPGRLPFHNAMPRSQGHIYLRPQLSCRTRMLIMYTTGAYL